MITDYIYKQRSEMISFLSALVQAESPTAEAAAQAEPQRILGEALEALGFEVVHLPGTFSGGSLLARRPDRREIGGRPQQLLLGHCDTVWARGTLADIPLVVDETAGIMRGPGVFDMKAGLTQMIFALRALAALDLEPAVTPVLFINSDEEVGSDDSRPYIEELAPQMDRVYVLEPSIGPHGALKTARKGVGRYEITAHGVASHAGLDPEKGRSAIVAMAHVVQELFAMNDLARGVSVNPGVIAGGTRSNVIAAGCRLEVDLRGLTLADMEEVDRQILGLRSRVDGVRLEIAGGINRPPLEKTAGNRQLWEMAVGAARSIPLDLEEGTAGGGSDGNLTSPFTPTLDGLGAAGDGAHATHEFIYLESLVERTILLAHLLLLPPVGMNNSGASL